MPIIEDILSSIDGCSGGGRETISAAEAAAVMGDIESLGVTEGAETTDILGFESFSARFSI